MGTKIKTQKIPLGFLQNLPKSLDQKIPCRITPSLRWNNNSQHCSANNVVCCCVLVAVVCKRFNNSQQHAAACNRVSKRTQHVTSWQTLGVVSTCWPAMLRPFALCTGLSNWQAINSLPKGRRVRTPSRKKNTCGSILVSEHLIFAFGEVAYGKFESVLVCDYRRRNEERKPSTYSRIYNSVIKKITWARPQVNWFIVHSHRDI